MPLSYEQSPDAIKIAVICVRALYLKNAPITKGALPLGRARPPGFTLALHLVP